MYTQAIVRHCCGRPSSRTIVLSDCSIYCFKISLLIGRIGLAEANGFCVAYTLTCEDPSEVLSWQDISDFWLSDSESIPFEKSVFSPIWHLHLTNSLCRILDSLTQEESWVSIVIAVSAIMELIQGIIKLHFLDCLVASLASFLMCAFFTRFVTTASPDGISAKS